MKENLLTNEELLTKSERARLQRNNDVCEMYARLRSENPDVPCHRIMNVVADKYNMSMSGVRNIVIERGLFTPNSEETRKESN